MYFIFIFLKLNKNRNLTQFCLFPSLNKIVETLHVRFGTFGLVIPTYPITSTGLTPGTVS